MSTASPARRARWIVIVFSMAASTGMLLHAVSGTAVAQESRAIERYLKSYRSVRMDPRTVAQRVRDAGRMTLPTEDGTLEIVLEPNDIRAPRYRADAVKPDGQTRPVTPEPIHTFRGTVPGISGSEVRFSFRNSSIEGIVITPQAWYLVEPMRHYETASPLTEMVVYRASDIVPESFGTCAASLGQRISHEVVRMQDRLAPQAMQTAAAGSISVADVVTEADYEFVTAYGSAAAANNEILDIMNQVDGIYRSQLSISLRIVYQHAWETSADPYASTDPGTMLSEFRSYGNSSFNTVPHDLAHMWTGKDMDGSTIGIAYVGVTCYAASYGYGISQKYTAAPGKYVLSAHEIGHNFGASHTEDASTPQSDCTNTIMNARMGNGTTFCPYSRTEITTHINQYFSCLASSGNCDANNDGQTNVLDLQVLANAILGQGACPGNCDGNKDGSVNALDIQLEANVILGLAACP